MFGDKNILTPLPSSMTIDKWQKLGNFWEMLADCESYYSQKRSKKFKWKFVICLNLTMGDWFQGKKIIISSAYKDVSVVFFHENFTYPIEVKKRSEIY